MRISTVLVLCAVVLLAGGVASVMRARSQFPVARFAPGDRVQVDSSYHWARGARGTVRLPPAPVAGLAGDWTGHIRRVKAVKGTLTFHWIEFDEPQRDAEGDGPYGGGEIDEAHLVAVAR
jgi:hypothetical protein